MTIWRSFGGYLGCEVGVEGGKITKVMFTHEWVIKINCPRNIENIFSQWKWKTKSWNFDFGKKNNRFSILRFFQILRFCFKMFDIFQIFRFFSTFSRFFQIFQKLRFSDFRFFWKCPDFVLQISRFFRFFNPSEFSDFSAN